MKKGKLTLGIVLGLLTIGFVVAQAQGAFDAGSDSAAINDPLAATAGVFCLDIAGACNDVKLVYQPLGGGYYALNGYEYGCNADERLVDGTMRIKGKTLYIGYTTITSYSYTTPRIGQYNVQLDLGTLSGPLQYAYHYESYHKGTGTAKIVPCTVSKIETNEPDVGL